MKDRENYHADVPIRHDVSAGGVTLTGSMGGTAKRQAAEEGEHGAFGSRGAADARGLHGPVFVCFPGQEDAGTTENARAAEGILDRRSRTLCDGPGCRAESEHVDGWLFVGTAGETRHYCRECLVPYLDRLRRLPAMG